MRHFVDILSAVKRSLLRPMSNAAEVRRHTSIHPMRFVMADAR